MSNSAVDIDEEILATIQERVLQAEKEQLHMKKPHNIIPEIQTIVKEEVQPTVADERD